MSHPSYTQLRTCAYNFNPAVIVDLVTPILTLLYLQLQ